MKDWLIAIAVVLAVYFYLFGGTIDGLKSIFTGVGAAVSQSDLNVRNLEQQKAVQPQAAPQVQGVQERQPDPTPNWGPQGLPAVQADTMPAVLPTPDQVLGAKGGYFVINGYRLYCDLITADLQYTGDPVMQEWWNRLSLEVKKLQKSLC